MSKTPLLVPQKAKSSRANSVKTNPFSQIWGRFWETRTYIFTYYLVVMAVFAGLSVPIFSMLVLNPVDIRVEKELREELQDFETLLLQFLNASESVFIGIFASKLAIQLSGLLKICHRLWIHFESEIS